ncbi:uncharacterized protein N7529_004945 [Penicillium soppii]|jgi:hypothetical protein|uniref:uncharacterized protein n=1 Tax=Penicillium soppii TaxID=69789 RepID=UPI0025486307|nr:uncharacterized protein N7529_004945 [Penicillium soppii]KAJ5872592.1 hypothetical protein N7529_004945 [Penicillium soppii]
MRVICAQNAPVLVLRRAWLSGARKWGVRLPDEGKGKGKGKGEEREKVELLNASMPWIGEGNLKIGVGGGFQLDLEFRNALALTTYRFAGRERTSSIPEPHICDEPPPYSDVAGDVEEERRSTQRNEKDGLFHDSNYGNASPEQSPPDIRTQPDSASILPSYASARLSSSNTLRDLLDAIEPPEDPAPAPELAPTSPFALSSSGSRSRPRSGHETADINTGQRVELKVLQSAASGTGVMMGNHRIMYITRHNAMDYSKSKSKLKARWEVQVAEGVDLLLVSLSLVLREVCCRVRVELVVLTVMF